MSSSVSTCWSCKKVKGKRICPARGGALICSKCCGTKRRVEISCPSDCAYLEGGHDAKWSKATQEKDEGRFLAHFLVLPEAQMGFLLFLHHVLLSRKAALTDSDLRDVLTTAEKTFETEQKGIVYQHHTDSPHLEPVARWLSQIIAARDRIPGGPPPTKNEDVARALEAMRRALDDHRELGSEERYLRRAKRVLGPWLEPLRVEVPDDLGEPPGDLIVSP